MNSVLISGDIKYTNVGKSMGGSVLFMEVSLIYQCGMYVYTGQKTAVYV